MMDREVFQSAEFKQLTKDVVLVHIDADQQPAVLKKYGVSALPTVKFFNAKNEQIDEFIGYIGFAGVMDRIKTNKAKA